MNRTAATTSIWRWPGIWVKAIIAALLIALVALLLLWLTGALSPKIPPAYSLTPAPLTASTGPTATAALVELPLVEPAVGVVSPIRQTALASQIMGRIVSLNLHAGMSVTRGQILVTLDQTQLAAQLAEAKANRQTLEAQLVQALDTQRRYTGLLKTGDITRQKLDLINTDVSTARAKVAEAIAAVSTAKAALAYTIIHSPINGIVVDRLAHRGDIAQPGMPLAHLYSPSRLQLIAVVREALVRRLHLGQKLPLELDGFKAAFVGTVRRIVPRVHAASRTFSVKVAAAFPAGVYRGMFGRIIIPLGRHRVLLIPSQAIQHAGQLNLVHVLRAGREALAAVQLGRQYANRVEVLAGLQAGEQVVLPANHERRQKVISP